MEIKQKIKAYGELMRLNRPVGIFLLLWPTWMALWFAAQGFPGWRLVVVFTLGVVLMRSAGCVINDYADRDIDGKVWRTKNRPLAEKRVTEKEALSLALILTLLAACLLLFLPLISTYIAVAAVGCATLYPWTKRFLPIPQAFLGITYSLGILMAWSAVTHTLPREAWLFWAANGAWVLAYDTAYAMADRPDDQGLGIHSSALWLGKWDVIAVNAFTILFFLGVSSVATTQRAGSLFWLGWFLALLWCLKLNNTLNQRVPAICLEVFKQHHWAGALMWMTLILSF
ncbi:MAG: 4-hydroxybenzoate octaprenyltransferase [Pseudomonadota bacterium]